MTFADKRQTPRFEAELVVVVERAGEPARGLTRNLSLGGAKIVAALDPAPKIGDRLGMRLELPTLPQPIEVQAEVRWLSGTEPQEIGVHFVTGLRAKEMWALQRYLDARLTPSP